MSDAPHPPRLPAWHPAHLIGAWRQRARPGDEKLRKKSGRAAKVTMGGLVAAFAYWSMGEIGGVLKAQRAALEALPAAVAQAIRESSAERRADAADLAAEVRALRQETAQHESADAVEFAQLRGVVAGRLRCPPCPNCPACPPASLGVPAQPDSTPWRPRER